jgi:CheY-like chemotaxis protein
MTSLASALPLNLAAEPELHSGIDLRRFGVEFLTSLNHAIRTPLSGILGLSELMLESSIDSENREYLISIRSCAAALNDLLSSTLDYASHASGAIRLEEQDFLLVTAIEAGLRDARQRAKDNGTAFEPVLADGMERIVRADALRLRDAVSLIARVAIHSAWNGQVHFRATLAPWGGRLGELVLEAWRETKTGAHVEPLPQIGLQESEELLSHSFSIETLEIALIHRLVALLRGSIRIRTEPDVPVAIRVTLPISFREEGLREDRESEAAARPAILIADDNRISLRVLSSILNRAEFESVAVDSGPAAIDALAHRNFDLVLLDLLMPGMDGGITTARIRELPNCADIPILGITAGVTDELRENCRRNGMDAILDKPIDAAELVASLRFHLGRSASGQTASNRTDTLI